jgi:uncharacterized protein
MSDYDEIMKLIMAGDINALEDVAKIVIDFPKGQDDFIRRDWITNAIDCGNAEVVKWMLDKQVPINFRNDEGYSVLHSVIEREQPDKYEIMKMLIKAGADVNAKGINDWTPAHMAAVRDDVEALKILHQTGADFTIRTIIDGYATPLEEAIALGRSAKAIAYLKTITE